MRPLKGVREHHAEQGAAGEMHCRECGNELMTLRFGVWLIWISLENGQVCPSPSPPMVRKTQGVVVNGQLFHFIWWGDRTAGSLLQELTASFPVSHPYGLFRPEGIQLEDDEQLPGQGEELTYRPVVVH